MRSSPRSGSCDWTRSCASWGSTPGSSARTMTTTHGGVTGTSPSQAMGATAWWAALATIARTAPAGRRIRTSNGCATRTRASESGVVAARPTVTRSGGGRPSGASPLPLCPSQNTTASLSLPHGATRHVGDATPHMARGRGIRAIPTDAALRGAARTTTAAPVPLALAATGRTTTATATTEAQHAAEAESRASGRGPVPGMAAGLQGARLPRATVGFRQPRPVRSSLPAAEDAQHQVPVDAGDAPHEDMDQEGAGSWGWGRWNASSWQSGSSGSGWWNQAGQYDNTDDAWSQLNRNRRAPRSSAGYGGADRSRPKLAHTAAALQRNLISEEWIEELIADHPSPAHPEFRAPGSWEWWVRGVFLTYRKLGDAKFRVKQKRANINMEARGATRDFDSRGGRPAAMDPSTARPGGQKRQERSRDDGDDRGAPVARGGDSGAAAARGSDEQPDGEMERISAATTRWPPPWPILAPSCSPLCRADEHPAADGPTAPGSLGTDLTTTTQSACAGEAGDRPADDQVAHGLPAGGAGEITGSGPG